MFLIKDGLGSSKNERSVQVKIDRQGVKNKIFTWTWGKTSITEAKQIIDSATRLFEDRMRLSDVFEMLHSIQALSNEWVVKDYINELKKRLKGGR